jgi:carboxylesterase
MMTPANLSIPDDREPADDSARPRPSCLVLHGLGGGAYELSPVLDALRAEGLRVSAPILPGHEGPGPIMPSSDWRDWARTAETAFDELAAAGAPVVVIGFSTGGTLALYLAGRRPVARQVLLAPFLAIRYSHLIPVRPSTYLRYIARVLPNIRRRPSAVRDRAMRRWADASSCFRSFSLGAALSALELIDEVKPLVPEIKVPTLIIQGRLDTVVEPRNARWLRDHLGASSRELVIMPRSDHLLALDRERERVVALTLEFVLGRVGSPAGRQG